MIKIKTNFVFNKMLIFLGLKLASNAIFVLFFMTFTKFLWPSNAFLEINLGRFNRHKFQVPTNFVMSCGILTCFGKNMTKIGSLKAFL